MAAYHRVYDLIHLQLTTKKLGSALYSILIIEYATTFLIVRNKPVVFWLALLHLVRRYRGCVFTGGIDYNGKTLLDTCTLRWEIYYIQCQPPAVCL